MDQDEKPEVERTPSEYSEPIRIGFGYKKVGIFLGIAFVMYCIVNGPNESADAVRDALAGVGDAAGTLAEFVRALVR